MNNKRNKKSRAASRNTLYIEDKYMERKEKITSFFFSQNYTPMTKKEIGTLLGIEKQDREMLSQIIDELADAGSIIFDQNRKYMPANEQNSYKGIYEQKNDRYGFVICENTALEDLYIPEENKNTALNGDKVLVLIDNRSKYQTHKKVGKIVAVLERNLTKIIGEVYQVSHKLFVQSIDNRVASILISKSQDDQVKVGDLVEVTITEYPNRHSNFRGTITRRIGSSDEVGAYVNALYIAYDLDKMEVFPKAVQEQVDSIPDVVEEQDKIGRVDKTKEHIYTIDSEDAKDLDDAISVKKRIDGSYDLSVFIADVSHYVKEGTPLDKEAIERATSIYIPGTVIPMLPKKLSNGICSLQENEVRLTLSIDMHIDLSGEVLDSNIYHAFIQSKKKMTYEKVNECLNQGKAEVLEEYRDYLEDIHLMKELAQVLAKKRERLGSINFDIPETKVELNKNGTVKDIHPYPITFANKIIEEFMLVTNTTVAQKFFYLQAPFVYRIHEKPDEEKIRGLNEVLNNYGKKIKSPKNVYPKEIADILADFKSEEEKKVVSTLALRTLKLAKYSNECLGHFGLAFKYYTHFTSPIRRYPDLFIHRIISEYLANSDVLSHHKIEKYTKQSIVYADISTEREKNATKIEREFDDLYMSIYMKDKVGMQFEGVISSVTAFGMFVTLDSTIEGLVHVTNMKGYYTFDEKHYLLVGDNKTYKIGDKVEVKLLSSDVKSKQIDFILV